MKPYLSEFEKEVLQTIDNGFFVWDVDLHRKLFPIQH